MRQTHRAGSVPRHRRGRGIEPGGGRPLHALLHHAQRGRRLSLSLCRTVIEQHGGALDSTPVPGGDGTGPFGLRSRRLPKVERQPRGNPRSCPPDPRRPERSACRWSYLVDDEDVLRDARLAASLAPAPALEGFAGAEAFLAMLGRRRQPALAQGRRAELPAAGRAHARHERAGAVRELLVEAA